MPPVCHAIAAMAENRAIGKDGALPWRLPEDFKWFQRATWGGVLVMGRKTFESIGKPLPGRETIVLSRSAPDIPEVRVIADPAELEALPDDRTVWIAGGAEIYRRLLPRCQNLYLSRVRREVDGDAFLPPFEDDFAFETVLEEHDGFAVEKWTRRR